MWMCVTRASEENTLLCMDARVKPNNDDEQAMEVFARDKDATPREVGTLCLRCSS